MSKFLSILSMLVFGIGSLYATKTEQTVLMGEGYKNNVYFSVETGSVKSEDASNWDIAFQTGRNAGIIINDEKSIKLYHIIGSNKTTWAKQIDTTGLSMDKEEKKWKQYFNSTLTWSVGAFNMDMDGFANNGNFGWGSYNMGDHGTYGNAVYLIQLDDKNFKKIYIEKLLNKKYYFKYANLDGSGEQTATISKVDYDGFNYAYFSLEQNKALAEREPNTETWDLLFCRYISKVKTNDGALVPYLVSGIKSNQKINVAKIANCNPGAVDVPDDSAFNTDLTRIGSDWKKLNNATFKFDIVKQEAYFVKNQKDKFYKIVFKSFTGSSKGEVKFDVYDMASTVLADKPNTAFAIHPNVLSAGEMLNVVYSSDRIQNIEVKLQNLSGQILFNSRVNSSDQLQALDIPTHELQAGVYFITLQANGTFSTQRIIIQ